MAEGTPAVATAIRTAVMMLIQLRGGAPAHIVNGDAGGQAVTAYCGRLSTQFGSVFIARFDNDGELLGYRLCMNCRTVYNRDHAHEGRSV